MYAIWKERQNLQITEQRLCDQARMIRVNGWLTELELDDTKRRVLNENNEIILDEGTEREEDGEDERVENIEQEERGQLIVENDALNVSSVGLQ